MTLRNAALFAVLLAGMGSRGGVADGAHGIAPPTGIYAVLPPSGAADARIAEDMLQNPLVDGVFLRVTWQDVEPAQERFDWTALDRQVAMARAAGKKVSIGVAAGIFTPEWVYAAGVASFQTVAQLRRLENYCRPVAVPIPWDPLFLKYWTDLVNAMGRRYSNNDAVDLVKFGGLNFQTWETILPHHGKRPNEAPSVSYLTKQSCALPDDVDLWREKGYTAARVSEAFERILRAYDMAFPDQRIAVMTGDATFPPLGDRGQPDPAAADISTTGFYRIGKALLADRFVGQDNALSVDHVAAPVRALARTNETGYQFEWPATGDAQCFLNHGRKPCDPSGVVERVTANAIDAGSCYLEAFPKDIRNPALLDVWKRTRDRLESACGRAGANQ